MKTREKRIEQRGRVGRVGALVRRARKAATPTEIVMQVQGRDLETGKAVIRAWLDQITSIQMGPAITLTRGDDVVAVIQEDGSLTQALEKAHRMGLTSQPNPTTR